nr:alpha/beta hydrolase [Burkholderia ubonensis]
MQLALEAPERVGRLVIANSFPAFNGDDVRAMVRSWIDTFREPDGPTKRFEKTWPINASEAFRRSAEGMRMYQLLHGLAAVANGESLAHVAEGIVGFDAEARLSHLEHDTLFVAGALDTMSPPALSRRMAEAAPRGRYIELPHAAHLSNVDSAQAFNEAVLAFLSDKG